jgi:hypothetical protein
VKKKKKEGVLRERERDTQRGRVEDHTEETLVFESGLSEWTIVCSTV